MSLCLLKGKDGATYTFVQSKTPFLYETADEVELSVVCHWSNLLGCTDFFTSLSFIS